MLYNMLLSVSSIVTTVLYIGLAICVLLFMIMIHEFGHYTAGKLLKFKINEFSIGFGKAIFSKTKKNGEKFSLRIFPLGGYCAFEGEDDDNSNVEGSFNSQKPWKRLIVLFMGAFFNFLSAIVFSAILLMSFGYSDKVQVNTVDVPSYVQETNADWLKKGDIIYAVDGVETNFVYDNYFLDLIEKYDVNESFVISVNRDGKNKDINVQKSWFNCPQKADETYGTLYSLDGINYSYVIDTSEPGKYKLCNIKSPTRTFTADDEGISNVEVIVDGISVVTKYKIQELSADNIVVQSIKIGITTHNYRYGFFEAIGQSFVFCFKWAWKILIIFWQLISGKLAITNMGGTVTTVVTIAEVTQTNIANLLLLVPLISINLAVFNLLPFPALDGARMVFVLIELIRKKPINRKLEGTIHFVGLMVLLLFVLIVDILHFVI